MLVMFRARNFSSFCHEVILDMRASAYKEHPGHMIATKSFNILKTAAIYGANASGKSNLISALYWFEQYIFNQLFHEQTSPQPDADFDPPGRLTPIEPFLLRDPVDPAIELEMIFIHDQIVYQYGFSFSDTHILTEWLSIDNQEVFDRTSDQLHLGVKYHSKLKNLHTLRKDRLYLSVLDYFATDDIKDMVDHFKSFFRKRYHVYSELILESSVKGTFGALTALSRRLVDDPAFCERVTTYIHNIDVGIENIQVEKTWVSGKSSGQQEVPVLKTVHPIYDQNGNRSGSRTFDLKHESAGTLRFLSFIQDILQMMESGGVFIIDELSSRLHPLLTKFIVDMFQSAANVQHAQLIFTTHDTSMLNNDQFRRDEIVFVDKNEKGESSLYSLADFKNVRSDATFSKHYFNGRFGAIPVFSSDDHSPNDGNPASSPSFSPIDGE